jgi:hypothetical protein
MRRCLLGALAFRPIQARIPSRLNGAARRHLPAETTARMSEWRKANG